MSGGATPITLSPGVATLSFTIEHTSLERDARGNVYTAYRVVTLHQGQEWAVSKRFNDFRALHELMKVHLPELPSNFPLWPNVFNRFDPAVIEERKVGLQRYLSDLVGQLRGPPPLSLRDFLQLPPDEEKSGADEMPLMAQATVEATVSMASTETASPISMLM